MGCFGLTVKGDKERLKDLRKLRRILKLVPADRKHIGEEIIERITFMAGGLVDL